MADLENLDVPKASDWRRWLQNNHARSMGVWVVFHKKGLPSIAYDEALDEALAYGWIDSIIRRVDDRSYVRKFSPRRPWSIWSTSNISRVEKLKKGGKMTDWGLEAFARRSGEISMLEKVNREGAPVPKDLEDALRKNRKAWANFGKFAPSHKKRYLTWIGGAKRPDTRKKRIDEAVVLISENLKNLLK